VGVLFLRQRLDVAKLLILRTKDRFSAKRALFLVLGIMSLVVLFHDERFIFDPDSLTRKFFYPVRWKIFAHGLGGATALVLGALQFSTSLRQRRPVVHRLLGRFYIGGVLTAAPVAIYLAFTHALPMMSVETTAQASLWALTTLMALLAARNRDFEVHKQWMMRSYAITLIFVVGRSILAVRSVAPKSDVGAEHLAWILVICAMLVPQLLINWKELFAKAVR
jgi:hypothetical protein